MFLLRRVQHKLLLHSQFTVAQTLLGRHYQTRKRARTTTIVLFSVYFSVFMRV